MQSQPDVESLIRNAGKDGWDFWNTGVADAALDEARIKHDRLTAIMAALDANAEFRALLEHLLDVTLRRVTFTAQLGLPRDQAYDYGLYREGQNSIVALLLNMIAASRKEKSPVPRDL